GTPKGKSWIAGLVDETRFAAIGLLAGALMSIGERIAFVLNATRTDAPASATDASASPKAAAPDAAASVMKALTISDPFPRRTAPAHPAAPGQYGSSPAGRRRSYRGPSASTPRLTAAATAAD